ncbi:hypothetical protein KIH41_07640 [Litoribacter ruber]|uniref:Uncharacterized protein n=1 Tax=Litoribacter ruber TaxID=702568 RepID=A0AAP2G2S0_9BACT|nr:MULTISPECIES: hypothetical protein [Litoribacter]MBS9522620.1 hypothetical protein [Litoribacter alkaliphilus]MBT0811149.1 hypothetical protein [Litoribacter ruber]
MNPDKISPVFQLFAQQYDEGHRLFEELCKAMKTKKVIVLEEKLIFIEIYLQLMAKIHFEEENLKFKLFKPFSHLFKCLKKVLHLKLIRDEFVRKGGGENFNSFSQFLETEKKELYSEVFDLLQRFPHNAWEELYDEVLKLSKGLKPLMINTATTKIINEEVEYSHFDSLHEMDAISIKDIYESLQTIIAVENFRIVSGLNPVFTNPIHDDLNKLSNLLLKWYQNHLLFQQLTYFFSEKESIGEKYKTLLDTIKKDKKKLTTKVISHSKELFTERLN